MAAIIRSTEEEAARKATATTCVLLDIGHVYAHQGGCRGEVRDYPAPGIFANACVEGVVGQNLDMAFTQRHEEQHPGAMFVVGQQKDSFSAINMRRIGFKKP